MIDTNKQTMNSLIDLTNFFSKNLQILQSLYNIVSNVVFFIYI